MSRISATLALLAALGGLHGAAVAAEPATARDGVLVDGRGMTLYTFDKDGDGRSSCHDACAANWPPLLAGPDAAASGEWSLVARPDGSRQWAYRGRPLYTFVHDRQPGERSGDGRMGVWHVAHPHAHEAPPSMPGMPPGSGMDGGLRDGLQR